MAAKLIGAKERNIGKGLLTFITTTAVTISSKSVCKANRRYCATNGQRDSGNDSLNFQRIAAGFETETDVAEFFQSLRDDSQQEPESIMKHWTRTTLRGGTSKIVASSYLAKSQVLGFNSQMLRERLEFLKSHGVQENDALIIAIDFPCFLDWDSSEFRDMLELLKSLGCNITKHLAKNPLVFSMNLSRALESVHNLSNAGVSNEVLGKVVDRNPLVLAYPFSSYALEIIQFMTNEGEIDEKLRTNRTYLSFDEFLLKLLSQPLDRPRKQVVLSENFRDVSQFLKELQISSRVLLLSCPEFFNTDADRLYDALAFFMGRPLLFETELVQRLVVNRPEIFMHFNLEQANRCVNLAASILNNPLKLYWLLQNSYFFEQGGSQLESNIKMFRDHGFEDKQIAHILTYKHFFSPKGGALKERLTFLLSHKEITVNRIAEYPLCLLLTVDNLRKRVAFIKAKNPTALVQTEMKKLFDVKHTRSIVKVCESSVHEYQEFKPYLSLKNKNNELEEESMSSQI